MRGRVAGRQEDLYQLKRDWAAGRFVVRAPVQSAKVETDARAGDGHQMQVGRFARLDRGDADQRQEARSIHSPKIVELQLSCKYKKRQNKSPGDVGRRQDNRVDVDGCHSSHRLPVNAQVVQLDGPLFRPSVEDVSRFVLDHLHQRIFFAERVVDFAALGGSFIRLSNYKMFSWTMNYLQGISPGSSIRRCNHPWLP